MLREGQRILCQAKSSCLNRVSVVPDAIGLLVFNVFQFPVGLLRVTEQSRLKIVLGGWVFGKHDLVAERLQLSERALAGARS